MFTKYKKNKYSKNILPILVLFGIISVFFYKTIFLGLLPFPGDLLVSGYGPWRHQSYGGYVTGAIPSKDQYFDVIRELYPWKTLVIQEVKKGRIPLWNPYNFSGSPLLANYQSQVFYPLSILYFIFPQITAWTILVILQPILGSLFMYLFAKEIGISTAGAILTSVLFNFSGFANVWMEFNTIWHTILWLPLLLYLIERGIKQKHFTFGQQILFIFGLISSITAGHPQDFINSFLFLLVYTGIRLALESSWTTKNKVLFVLYPLSFIFLTPFFITAAQLLPTIELYKNSARVFHDYNVIVNNMLVQWWQLPLLVVQEFFGNPATKSNLTGDYVGKTLSIGTVGFFLWLASIANRVKSWHKTFFLSSGLAVLLITVNTPLSQLFYRYPLPILSTGTPTRILFILALSLSILAGFGFDALWKSKTISWKTILLTWIIISMLWGFSFLYPHVAGVMNTQGSKTTIVRALAVATSLTIIYTLVILISKKRKILLVTLIALCAIELFYGFHKFNPFVPKLFVFPENKLMTYLKTNADINRFWGYGTAAIEANFATQEKIFSPDGTDPLNLKWYNQFLQASRDGNIALTFDRTTRSDAQIQTGYGETDLPTNEYRLRILDVLGVKYIIDRSENPQNNQTFPTDRFRLALHENDWTIYENLYSAPRFFMTNDVRPYTDIKNFETQFFANNFIPNKTVLLNVMDYNTLPQLLYSNNASIKLISYQPTNIQFSVFTDTPQFLFLSDTYDKGWTALVNHTSATVIKANYAFRGVVVPQGQSSVEFVYKPKSFQTGITISLISLFLFLLYCVLSFILKRNRIARTH